MGETTPRDVLSLKQKTPQTHVLFSRDASLAGYFFNFSKRSTPNNLMVHYVDGNAGGGPESFITLLRWNSGSVRFPCSSLLRSQRCPSTPGRRCGGLQAPPRDRAEERRLDVR